MPKVAPLKMTVAEVLDHFSTRGRDTHARTYRNHGAREEVWGVPYSELYALQKKVKVDHPLAQALWETGNLDARLFACLISDPEKMDLAQVRTWLRDCDHHIITTQLALAVIPSRHAQAITEALRDDPNEWAGQVAWTVSGNLPELPDAYFEPLIAQIEREVHGRPNRTRYAMMSCLIGIGQRNAHLRDLAKAAAERIGKVHVDHGKTSCKTPNPLTEIDKAFAHRQKKAG